MCEYAGEEMLEYLDCAAGGLSLILKGDTHAILG